MADTGTPSGIGWPELDDRVEFDRDESSTVATEGRHSAGRVQPVGWPEFTGRIEPASTDGRNGAAVVSRETFEPESVAEPAPEIEALQPDPGGIGQKDAGGEAVADEYVQAAPESEGGSPEPLSMAPAGEPAQSRAVAVAESTAERTESAVGEESPGGITAAPAMEPEVLGENASVEDLEESPPLDADDDAEPTEVLPRLPLLGDSLPLPDHGRVLVVANQKGGVGKTTTAVNLAAALVAYGARVLVVDLDPQGNASTALGIAHQEDVDGVYEVLIGDRTMAEVVRETPGVPGLYGAPATIKLAGAEIELVSFVARESRLKRPLESYLAEVAEAGEGFDYVLIDCPPSLGLLTLNALVAAKEVLIPIQCEYYALEGVSQLLRTIELVQRELNQDLWVSTVILTMYDGRTRLAAGVAEEVRAHFGDRVLRTAVPRSVRISEAPSYGQTVITHDPTSSGALSYLEAAREFALL